MAVSRGKQRMTSWMGVLLGVAFAMQGVRGIGQRSRFGSTRSMQAEDAPVVGVNFATGIGGDFASWSVTDDLVENLEEDDQVTVTGEVQVGALVCDTLAGAEDASHLQFFLSPGESIIADKTSYTVVEGSTFSDGIGRKIWSGAVSEGDGENGSLATVSMTWGEVCDVETFLLQVATLNLDGSVSATRSIPCDVGSSLDICMVDIDLNLNEEAEPTPPPTKATFNSDSGSSRRLGAEISAKHRNEATADIVAPGRKLQSSTQITVMYLYSEKALLVLGISDSQMETVILGLLAKSNEGMANSEIGLEYSIAYIGPLPYYEGTITSSDSLSNLYGSAQVAALRDTYSADLVQHIGYFNDGYCGRGYIFDDGDESLGFSVVRTWCFDGLSPQHEFGHNLGCSHNREISDTTTDYGYGYRNCDVDNRYHTVVSYRCSSGSTRINYFSSPSAGYLGQPTGTTIEDNARLVRDNMIAVANYRTSALETTDDDSEPVSTCENGLTGVQSGDYCCTMGCGTCGGSGCSERGLGLTGEDCCTGNIEAATILCSESKAAPCIIVPETTDDDSEPASTCEHGVAGVQSGSYCCTVGCETCGGSGCSARGFNLTREDCCTTDIEVAGVLCSESETAPCIIAPETTDDDSEPTSYCENGITGVQSGDYCCTVACGTCGGSGCSARGPGLTSEDCCTSDIEAAMVLCSESGIAPCTLIG